MYTLDFKSSTRLATCHEDIQKVILKVIDFVPILITAGHRGKDEQDRLYLEKKTQVLFPHSKHNSMPSVAVDIVLLKDGKPEWNDRDALSSLASLVMGIAWAYGVNLRWGGDWDQDGDVSDNKFDDLFHFELVP